MGLTPTETVDPKSPKSKCHIRRGKMLPEGIYMRKNYWQFDFQLILKEI